MSVEAKKPHLLIVDDDRVFCDLLAAWLRDGYDLTIAHDGEEALKEIRDRLPDLLLLDVMMPKLSGLSVAWVVRNDPRYREIPVIFMTAHAPAIQDVEKKLSRANDRIFKPFSLDKLLELLKRHLPSTLREIGVPRPSMGADRRLALRLSVEIPCLLISGTDEFHGNVRSLSLMGAFLQGEIPLDPGAGGYLRLADGEKWLDLPFQVLYEARREGEHGIGVQFGELREGQESLLQDLLGRLTEANVSKA